MKKLSNIFSQYLSGTVLGGILLLSGSCIGVGMLALPIVTGLAGFSPSLLMMSIAWLFMFSTALLILELLLLFPGQKSFISLTEKTLGPVGKPVFWLLFVSLFYSIIIAYLIKGGQIVQSGFMQLLPSFPQNLGALLLAAVVGITIIISVRFVDNFNRLCMAGLFLTYFYLVFLGKDSMNVNYLTHVNWKFSMFSFPILIIAFGFHNVLPTVREYIGNKRNKLIVTIFLGSLIAFAFYLFWMLHVLSIVPPDGAISIQSSYLAGEISSEPLAKIVAKSSVSATIQVFAFFAIITSLFGQSLSVLDFIADGLHITRSKRNRFLLSLSIFIPCFFFSQVYPGIFFKLLEFGGGVIAVALFGLYPIVMIWNTRYRQKLTSKQILPGGKVSLTLLFIVALYIIGFEVYQNIF